MSGRGGPSGWSWRARGPSRWGPGGALFSPAAGPLLHRSAGAEAAGRRGLRRRRRLPGSSASSRGGGGCCGCCCCCCCCGGRSPLPFSPCRTRGPRCAWRGGREAPARKGGPGGSARGPAAAGGGGEQARQAAAAPLAPQPHTRGHQRKRRPLTARPSFQHGTDDSSKRDCHRRRRRLPSRGLGELTPPGRRRRRPARTTRPAAGPSLAPGRPHPHSARRSSSVGPGLLRPWWIARRFRPAR